MSPNLRGGAWVGRLRIAYLTSLYPSVSHTFIRREISALEAMGFEVMRLSIRPPSHDLPEEADRVEKERTITCLSQPGHRLLSAVTVVAMRRPYRFLAALGVALEMSRIGERGLLTHLAYLVEACFLLRAIAQQDVEHVHAHFGTSAVSVVRIMRELGGPPYSFTVHGPDELDAPRAHSVRKKIEGAAFVVAISDYCGAQLRRWVNPAQWSKIRIVRCAIPQEWFDAAQEVSPTSHELVCVARLSAQKGHLILLDAMAEVVRAGVKGTLVLAGDGEMRPEIERRIEERGLQDRVRITGWIDEAEVKQLLLGARALVLASFAEGLPVAIMEAFALGRPVVATYIAGIPELVRPGENGWLVPAGNTEALADAMREALEAPVDQLGAMGERGRALTYERHRIDREVARLAAMLRDASVRGRATDEQVGS